MSYDLEKWMANTPRPRRSWVRWTLLGGLMATIAAAVATIWDADADARNFTALFPWGFLPLLALSYSPFARDAWAGSARHAAYDEMERQQLHRATAIAYHVLAGLAALLLGWLWLGALYNLPRPSRPIDWSGMVFALCVAAGTLPALVAEFLVPPPPAGDDDD